MPTIATYSLVIYVIIGYLGRLEGYNAVLVNDKACFNRKHVISAPLDGTIIGIKLTLVNSTNNQFKLDFWNQMDVSLLGMNNSNISYPTRLTEYDMTEDSTLKLLEPEYKLSANDSFSLHLSNNYTCGSLYFLYKSNDKILFSVAQIGLFSGFVVLLCLCIFILCRSRNSKSRKLRAQNRDLNNPLLNNEMTIVISKDNSKPEGIRKSRNVNHNYLNLSMVKPEGVGRTRNISENSELLYVNPDKDGDMKETTGVEQKINAIVYMNKERSDSKDSDLMYDKPIGYNVTQGITPAVISVCLKGNKEGFASRKPSEFNAEEIDDGHKRTNTGDSTDSNTM